jgi:hypothetical protein
MSTENQARSLMMRHHQMVKNRQQSMLNRTATEVGMEDTHYWGHIQGKAQPSLKEHELRQSSISPIARKPITYIWRKPVMSTQQQARSLMMRHQHLVKNRQESMLSRVAAEVGLDTGSQVSVDRK